VNSPQHCTWQLLVILFTTKLRVVGEGQRGDLTQLQLPLPCPEVVVSLRGQGGGPVLHLLPSEVRPWDPHIPSSASSATCCTVLAPRRGPSLPVYLIFLAPPS
jgi:hypothetical protein